MTGAVVAETTDDVSAALYRAGMDAYASRDGHRAPALSAAWCAAVATFEVGNPLTLTYGRAFTAGWDAAADKALRAAEKRRRNRLHTRRAARV